jgi:hypothetical protein
VSSGRARAFAILKPGRDANSAEGPAHPPQNFTVVTFADRYTRFGHPDRSEGAKILLSRTLNSLAILLTLCPGLASRAPEIVTRSALRQRANQPDLSAIDSAYKLLAAEIVWPL